LQLFEYVDDPASALDVLKAALADEVEPKTPAFAKCVTPRDVRGGS
jgi:hypothetical protein